LQERKNEEDDQAADRQGISFEIPVEVSNYLCRVFHAMKIVAANKKKES
jgi:hypothetical protein